MTSKDAREVLNLIHTDVCPVHTPDHHQSMQKDYLTTPTAAHEASQHTAIMLPWPIASDWMCGVPSPSLGGSTLQLPTISLSLLEYSPAVCRLDMHTDYRGKEVKLGRGTKVTPGQSNCAMMYVCSRLVVLTETAQTHDRVMLS